MLVSILLNFIILLIAQVKSCEENEGDMQSPINIDIKTIITRKFDNLQWSRGYHEVPVSSYVLNKGRSLKLFVNTSSPLTLSSGILNDTYKFHHLHFHWSDSDRKGSEHHINNYSYPLEMHVVHTPTRADNTDHYAVVAYFFRVSRSPNKRINELINAIPKAATGRLLPMKIKPIPLNHIFPTILNSYYHYKGSLTVVPYTEPVSWIVVDHALPISRSQLEVFRDAAKTDSDLLNNYRHVQCIKEREIFYVTR